jgi:hypothetical protein
MSYEAELTAEVHVASEDRLVHFLYVLMRQSVTSGEIEKIMADNIEKDGAPAMVVFSDPFLAAKAVELAERLKGASHDDARYFAMRELGAR